MCWRVEEPRLAHRARTGLGTDACNLLTTDVLCNRRWNGEGNGVPVGSGTERRGHRMALAEVQIPDTLLAALDAGELSRQQLRQLIELEARSLGLTFDEVLVRARDNALPPTPQGFDLQFHVLMFSA